MTYSTGLFQQNTQPGQQQQNPVQSALAQILQMRKQSSTDQLPQYSPPIPMSNAASDQKPNGGINDIASAMGWSANPKATDMDNKISAFQHVFSILGFG